MFEPAGIVFANSVPSYIRTHLLPMLQSCLHLLPRWVVSLNVDFVEDVSHHMSMTVQYQYRELHLSVTSSALMLPGGETELLRLIVHEFMHAYTIPVFKIASEQLQSALEEKHYESVESSLRNTMEETTCDLAYLVERLINSQ